MHETYCGNTYTNLEWSNMQQSYKLKAKQEKEYAKKIQMMKAYLIKQLNQVFPSANEKGITIMVQAFAGIGPSPFNDFVQKNSHRIPADKMGTLNELKTRWDIAINTMIEKYHAEEQKLLNNQEVY